MWATNVVKLKPAENQCNFSFYHRILVLHKLDFRESGESICEDHINRSMCLFLKKAMHNRNTELAKH